MGDVNGTQDPDGIASPALRSEADSLEEGRRKVELAHEHVKRWKRDICPLANPKACWRAMLSNLTKTTRVCVGTTSFSCYSTLLKFHSNYFERHLRPVNSEHHFVIDIDRSICEYRFRFREGADLLAVGFRAAYTWMRLKQPLEPSMPPEKLVVLTHTAMQLEMPTLLAKCYELLCTVHYREEIAFQVYLNALRYPQLEALRKVMLQRIGNAFLAVIGGNEFLRMPLEDVMTMLQQDTLGVNTEVEVIVAIVRWLTVNAHDMARATAPLMACLRLTLLPLSMLQRFWSSAMAPWKPNEPFMNIFRGDCRMRERISCAITVAQLQHLYTTRREFLKSCRSRGFVVDTPREWIYDEECCYHLPRPSGPYSHTICIHVLVNYAIRRAQRLTETSFRWSRGFSHFLPDSDDLEPIAEDSEDKDEEAEVPGAPGEPGEPQQPVAEPLQAQFRHDRETIERELEGLRTSLSELVERANRRVELRDELERRIRELEGGRHANPWETNLFSGTSGENFNDLAMFQDGHLSCTHSDFNAEVQDASDSYFYEHVCRLRELILPETVDYTEESSVEHVRPMENYLLNTELMILRLLEQLDVDATP